MPRGVAASSGAKRVRRGVTPGGHLAFGGHHEAGASSYRQLAVCVYKLLTTMRPACRRGPPIVLEVLTAEMTAARHVFRCAPNGVWLMDAVPPQFLRFPAKIC